MNTSRLGPDHVHRRTEHCGRALPDSPELIPGTKGGGNASPPPPQLRSPRCHFRSAMTTTGNGGLSNHRCRSTWDQEESGPNFATKSNTCFTPPPPPQCENDALVRTTVGIVSATSGAMSDFALHKKQYIPLSEQHSVSSPSKSAASVLFLQRGGGTCFPHKGSAGTERNAHWFTNTAVLSLPQPSARSRIVFCKPQTKPTSVCCVTHPPSGHNWCMETHN